MDTVCVLIWGQPPQNATNVTIYRLGPSRPGTGGVAIRRGTAGTTGGAGVLPGRATIRLPGAARLPLDHVLHGGLGDAGGVSNSIPGHPESPQVPHPVAVPHPMPVHGRIPRLA
jgi:hypothetical protein